MIAIVTPQHMQLSGNPLGRPLGRNLGRPLSCLCSGSILAQSCEQHFSNAIHRMQGRRDPQQHPLLHSLNQ